jgi:putative Mg2+ transporter-C (MgtC) family protein
MRQGESTAGNATTVSIWTVRIIGAAVGYGYFDIGLILAVANLRAHFLPDSVRSPDIPNDNQPD